MSSRVQLCNLLVKLNLAIYRPSALTVNSVVVTSRPDFNKGLPRFIITEDQLHLSERLGRKRAVFSSTFNLVESAPNLTCSSYLGMLSNVLW